MIDVWILVLLACFVLFFFYCVVKRKFGNFFWIFKLKFFFYSLFILFFALVIVYLRLKF